MSYRADRARLEYLLKLIDDLNVIVGRHGSVTAAIQDVEGFHAVMMCCLQLGETLNKLETPSLREKLPVSLAYSMRNIIAHDYLGINLDVIVATVENDIPDLNCRIESILGAMPDT
ncbi:MAG: HepT-like ribonuclease domain-containing protein [Deltaproteobacteria bacterium]